MKSLWLLDHSGARWILPPPLSTDYVIPDFGLIIHRIMVMEGVIIYVAVRFARYILKSLSSPLENTIDMYA